MAEPWLNGGPNCVTIPGWQVHEYNEDFYILRESGCVNPEKPFLYLIFGENKALLEDTGVARLMPDGTRGTVIPTAPVIMDLMAKWAARKKHAPLSLVVIHSSLAQRPHRRRRSIQRTAGRPIYRCRSYG